MSHDAHHSAPASPGRDDTPDAHTPAVKDARKILLILLGAIAVWSAIVHLFVF